MGMSQDRLNMQIQQETQKAIANLQNNMMQLHGVMQIIDANQRQAFSALYTDTVNLRIRFNFLLEESKKKMTTEELADFEERFKTYFKEETDKVNENAAKAAAAMAKAREEAEAKAKESQQPTKLVQ